MKTLEQLAEKYGVNHQQMLDHMLKTVQTYGTNINPNEYFSVIEDWIMSLNRYMIHIILAAADDNVKEKAEKEFMDYAVFDKIARLYTLLQSKTGKKIVAADGTTIL